MEIEFFGDLINRFEHNYAKAYIGYFSPDGKLVDYNTELGGSHSILGNIVSWTFLLWIKQSGFIAGLDDIKIYGHLNTDNGNITGVTIPKNIYNVETNLKQLQTDLIKFLQLAKNNEEFINNIVNKVDYDRITGFINNGGYIPASADGMFDIEKLFGKYCTKQLLLYLKDICVQYLAMMLLNNFVPTVRCFLLKNGVLFPHMIKI